ncbi:MAG: L-erythro-3,5-diaminohexanoate dehydrogenase [Bdellovibrionales bacterium RIFOXYD12_FULL_39_22]|nr:MAG: L-erythro-3,5-diaminohexanoate dehydrogenase [Bdellovibrionales bacterium RIFOXYB1_FULL_39_21]OFZ42206.1 MAG: L-erythro-3,5-diaminohexanoate dehydrogenase [Bdellovibrionales bacterium RIFOXYC12_FULL_39_17]OFZ46702.1 MAG: L-erythro-3,5-diaminohexanoate dehydrogenase [Bdellovibrionales bacterium RIFOXYC1_FULL_39_130]OFZ74234.1 MAG: L-erythro-3,5-diaminohexanoate dehydrogenase [Bdellovibrionales bacterium RIFOXYC2_FULL_39_8]OFZ76021.1 MAG: L-erythro-3,5-diaminohexanoate dehydrogenase [Bdel
MRANGCKYGTHRVISPSGALPQNAQKVDNSLPIYDNEILVEVDTLNIDAASFRQIKESVKGDIEGIKKTILGIVSERGKQQNPVTGSGGMLLGTIKEIGNKHPNPRKFKVGDKIASLVSLSLTPLKIEKIIEVFPGRDQVKIKGHAVFFESGVLAKIPANYPETLALAILDVAGAPAQALRLVRPGMNVVIIGAGGKSGSICCAVARDILKHSGKLIAIQPSEKGCQRLRTLGYCDEILQVDATNPVACMKAVSEVTRGEMADLVINCAPVENTEMSSIMTAKLANSTVYFFTMATSFTKAALGAEGIGSDALLIVGNGYAPNHDEIALEVINRHPELRELFEKVYA